MKTADATRKIDRLLSSASTSARAPHLWAFTLALFFLLLSWRPLADLVNLALRDENSSHTVLIPLLSALVVWLERKRVFRSIRYSPAIGLPLLLSAVLLHYASPAFRLPGDDVNRLSIAIASLVLTWIAVFLLCYGVDSFKAALFPLLYLSLMIPIPPAAMYRLISFLQKESADTSYVLFRLLGIPVLRHGFVFSLPGIDLEVARQCSGIHSALSLFIAGLLAAHFVVPGRLKKICFVAAILPIAIFKNAVRIATLAWLGLYVNPAVFDSPLHRRGGIPFSVVALVLMGALIWILRRPFGSSRRGPFAPPPASPKPETTIELIG